MAEIDTNLGNLWWMQKAHWLDSQPEPSIAGQADANRNFLLKVSEFDVNKRAKDADTAGQLLANQAKVQQLDAYNKDIQTWQQYLPKLNSASTPEDLLQMGEPNFLTPHAQQQWSALTSQRSHLMAQTADAKMFSDFLADRSKLDAQGVATLNEVGGVRSFNDVTPEHLIVMGQEQDRMQKDAQNRALALRAVAPEINAQSRENVAILRSMQMDEQAKASGEIVPATMADGTPIPGMVKFWSGKSWQTRNVHDKDAWKAMTPSQQISGLGKLISVSKGIAEGGLSTPEEVKKAHDDMLKYTAELADLMHKHPNAAAATPATTGPVSVKNKAERDALPPGTSYIGPDGQTYIKQ